MQNQFLTFHNKDSIRKHLIQSFSLLRARGNWDNIRSAEKMINRIEMTRDMRLGGNSFGSDSALNLQSILESDVIAASSMLIEECARFQKNHSSFSSSPSPGSSPTLPIASQCEFDQLHDIKKENVVEKKVSSPERGEEEHSETKEYRDIWTEKRFISPVHDWFGIKMNALSHINDVIESYDLNTLSGINLILKKVWM
jgi:hypothetical protein